MISLLPLLSNNNLVCLFVEIKTVVPKGITLKLLLFTFFLVKRYVLVNNRSWISNAAKKHITHTKHILCGNFKNLPKKASLGLSKWYVLPHFLGEKCKKLVSCLLWWLVEGPCPICSGLWRSYPCGRRMTLGTAGTRSETRPTCQAGPLQDRRTEKKR